MATLTVMTISCHHLLARADGRFERGVPVRALGFSVPAAAFPARAAEFPVLLDSLPPSSDLTVELSQPCNPEWVGDFAFY